MSYGTKGVAKPSTKKSEHGIVYIGKSPPEPSTHEMPRSGEQGMQQMAIRIDPDSSDEHLEPSSRLNYGKVYTVEHNIKVRNIGMVNRDSERALAHQFSQVWRGNIGSRRDSVAEAKSDAETSQRQQQVALMSRGYSQQQAAQMLGAKGKQAERAQHSDDDEEESEEEEEDEESSEEEEEE